MNDEEMEVLNEKAKTKVFRDNPLAKEIVQITGPLAVIFKDMYREDPKFAVSFFSSIISSIIFNAAYNIDDSIRLHKEITEYFDKNIIELDKALNE